MWVQGMSRVLLASLLSSTELICRIVFPSIVLECSVDADVCGSVDWVSRCVALVVMGCGPV